MSEKKSILVVEPDPAFREVLASSLSSRGYLVYQAMDISEALATLAVRRIHGVVCDICLKGLLDPEFLRLARRSDCIPFLVMLGFSDLLEARVVFAQGRVEFVAKPFAMESLERALELCLDDRQSNAEGAFREVTLADPLFLGKLPADVYFKFDSAKMVKVAFEGSVLPLARLREYGENKIESLFMRSADFARIHKNKEPA